MKPNKSSSAESVPKLFIYTNGLKTFIIHKKISVSSLCPEEGCGRVNCFNKLFSSIIIFQQINFYWSSIWIVVLFWRELHPLLSRYQKSLISRKVSTFSEEVRLSLFVCEICLGIPVRETMTPYDFIHIWYGFIPYMYKIIPMKYKSILSWRDFFIFSILI